MNTSRTADGRVSLMILCAALVFGLTFGIRQSVPLFIGPINSATGLGLGAISLAFGLGQLMWGVTQPLAGTLTRRYGNGPVLAVGALMIAAGTALTPFAHSLWALIVVIAVLGMGGAGVTGPAVLMAAVSAKLPPQRRAMASALVNAGGSLGQFVVVPVAQLLFTGIGWTSALVILGAAAVAVIPLSRTLWGPPPSATVAHNEPDVAVRTAVRDPSFRLLSAGFFVCGFHVAFLATHLPGVVAACGLTPEVGAWTIAVLGLFNIAGSFGIGWAMNRWRSKKLLSLLYAFRGLSVAAFLAAPKTPTTFMLFAAALGLSYLSTVPATANVVARIYGLPNMATLFGLVMLSHQVGGFLGAWLGGRTFEASGSYDWMWYADIVLAVFAAIVHLPIREPAVGAAPAPARA